MTAVRFTGGYGGSALVEKGWAADRTIARQVKTVQASTPAGVAVYYRGHPARPTRRRAWPPPWTASVSWPHPG